jgi:microcystin-dependent protein
MASTYSTDLRLELIGSGEQSGVWGSTTNLNLGSLVEQAVAGVQTISITSSNQALTAFYGAVDESRNAVIVLSSAAAANVYVPPVSKVYVVKNTGSYAITMYNSTVLGNTTAAGTGLAVAAGTTVSMFTDGFNFYASGIPTGATTGTGNIVYSASPTLTGTPLAPTASVTTDNTQIATTAFVRDIIPSGIISLWSGSVASIPSGWLLCDGSNSTPDLRDRFVVGAGSTYAVAATGGSANATLVSHTHTATSTSSVTDPGHLHSAQAGNFGSSGSSFLGGGPNQYSYNTNTNTTGISVSTSTSLSTEGSSATNANLPPYYALAYIMKA